MLRKLYLFELKASAQYFIALFAAILVMSVINSISLNLTQNAPAWVQGLLLFIQWLLISATSIVALVVIIRRFSKNLLGQEGYLMFTLPVSTHHNILAKLLAGMTWSLACSLIYIVSIFIVTLSLPEFFEALELFAHFLRSYDIPPTLIFLQIAVVSLLGMAGSILLIYLALAFGQIFNERKSLAATLFYIGAVIVLYTIFTIIAVSLSISFPDRLLAWLEGLSPFGISQVIFFVILAITLVLSAICYFFTHRLLHNKLNLS